MTAHAIIKVLRGHWHGSYGTARCPTHDDARPSLSVSERDGKLLVRCHAGCLQQVVWAELQRLGLLPERNGGRDHGRTSRRRDVSMRRKALTEARPAPDSEAKTAFARQVWHETRPTAGTPVEIYLASRGIMIKPPPTLRYHPALKHGPTGLHLPALVAAVTVWPNREVVAIHRTFLKADGSGKAPISKAKLMLGPCSGGAVRLAAASDELVLAEGIETGLSVLQASGRPTWVTLSTSGLKAIILPPEVRTVVIAADGDEPGEKAAEEAGGRFCREGREVKIARPPAGMDFNDLLVGCGLRAKEDAA